MATVESPLQETKEGKTKTGKSFMTNPMISKLYKTQERVQEGQACASYRGIAWKTVIFLLITLGGVALYSVLHSVFVAQGGPTVATSMYDVPIQMYIAELPYFVVATVLTIAMPFLTWAAKGATALWGTIYSVAQGYFLGFLAFAFGAEYAPIMVAALAITLALVLIMLLLYVTRIVKVGKKFRTIITTLFAFSLLSGLLGFVTVLAAPTSWLARMILSENGVFAIVCSLVGIVIATLFLLSDFDTIEMTVEQGLPKKYEWMAAFGLVFTVIWLYMKVLQLLLQVFAKRD